MCFCVLLYFTACVLYYCNTVGWAWWDWGLIWWLTIVLQCFDTVGWVTWPVKISSPNDLYCVELDVKPYSTTTTTTIFNFWHTGALALGTEHQSARMSKIKNGGLDQYGAGPFEQQQFGIAGIERVNKYVQFMKNLKTNLCIGIDLSSCVNCSICRHTGGKCHWFLGILHCYNTGWWIAICWSHIWAVNLLSAALCTMLVCVLV